MKRWLAIVGYGAAGIVVALSLSLGAFALAGKNISQPASTIDLETTSVAATPAPTGHESPKPEKTEKPERNNDHGGDTVEPTPMGDDHGGDSTSGSDDASSSGSGDGSGSGSDSEDGDGEGGEDD